MNSPKLRFKNFNDEWKTFKIQDTFDNISIKNCPNMTILTIIQGHGTIPRNQSNRNIIFDEEKSRTYKMVNKKDFIIHLRSFEGGLEMSNHNGIVSPAYTIIRGKDIVIPLFFKYYFRTNKFINSILSKSVEGIRDGKQISYNQLKDFYIPIPSLEEQTKIANFLSLIDKKIELQEKLVENLKLYKKGLLQKVFSNNLGWKSAKLGDFLVESKIIETNTNLNKRLTVRLNLLGIEARNPNYAVEKEEGSTQYRRKAGQFIYGKQNLHKGAFGIIPNYLNNYQSSSDLPSFDFKNDINPIFFYYFMSRENYYKSLESISTGTGSKRINPINFLNLDIKIPSIEEQNRIANLFSNLDKKIDFETNRLTNLKEYKKGLLQQMFI